MADTQVWGGFEYTREGPGQPWRKSKRVGPQPIEVAQGNPYGAPQAAANVDKTQTDIVDTQADNAREDKKMAADLFKEGLRIGPNGQIERIPGWTPQPAELSPEKKVEDRDRISRLNQVAGQIDRVYELYTQSVGKTKNFRGVADYLPSDANSQFDAAGASLSQQGLAAFRVPGSGTVSDRDAIMFDRANLPTASTRDSAIEEQLRGLRARVDEELKSLGVAPREWKGVPKEEKPQGSALDKMYLRGGDPLQAAAFGETKGIDQYPPELVQAHEALVGRLMMQGGGRIDPQAYAQAKAELLGKFPDFAAGDPQADIEWATRVNEYVSQGGKTVPTGIEPPERDLDVAERMLTNLNTPAGAAGIGFADAVSAGGVSGLAPDQTGALTESQPLATAIGNVGGAVTGTGLLRRVAGGAVSGAITPRMAAYGRMRLGRDGVERAKAIGTDTLYSAIYGANTGQGPMESAAWGAGGSVAGRAAGRVVGGLTGGVDAGPAIARLREQGVTPTLGQIARGRASANGDRSLVAGVEDVVANNGAAGTFVNAARNRTLEQANLAGLRIGANGRPITEIGEDGLGQLEGHVDNTFSNALDHVNLPHDPPFAGDMGAVRAQGAAIDAARGRGDFGYIDQHQLTPLIGGPNINGQQLQDGLRLARGQSRAYRRAATGPQPDPMAGGVADAVDGAHDAMTGLAGRHYPDTIPGLNEANGMYRNLLILDDAAGRAVNEGGTWTAGQLASAIRSNRRSLGGNGGLRGQAQSPLHQLQQDMAEVLPNKVPPTGVNAAPMLAIGGAAMGGAGAATDNEYLQAGGLLALAATPYTRTGQRAVASALLDRPDAMRTVGGYINTHRGLFGRGALPFALSPAWTEEDY